MVSQAQSTLREQIARQIEATGPLSFSAFMERALYEPGLGFYRRGETIVGRAGHFYTSASVGSLFGELLGHRIYRQWEKWGRPEKWILAEQGAHEGCLMSDLLVSIRKRWPAMLEGMEIWVFEPDPVLRARQREHMSSGGLADRMCWFNTPSEAEEVRAYGIFYSNELLDSLPFDLVIRRDGRWREKRVMVKDSEFIWAESDCSPEQEEWIRHWEIPELEGYQTEIHPGVSRWGESVYRLFSQGMIMTIDYGFRSRDYYSPSRSEGTARSYRNHRQGSDLLQEPGEVDLTCHVNFDLLRQLGEPSGYEVTYNRDQYHFLVEQAGQSGMLAEWEERVAADPEDASTLARIRQFKTLMHPEMMGRQFKVFIQEK
jgi:SAM-dependent MidA family methyltransferase